MPACKPGEEEKIQHDLQPINSIHTFEAKTQQAIKLFQITHLSLFGPPPFTAVRRHLDRDSSMTSDHTTKTGIHQGLLQHWKHLDVSHISSGAVNKCVRTHPTLTCKMHGYPWDDAGRRPREERVQVLKKPLTPSNRRKRKRDQRFRKGKGMERVKKKYK